MKKLVALALSALMLVAMPFCVSAQEPQQLEKIVISEETVDLGNGLTVVTTIRATVPKARARAASETISADKTSSYRVSGEEVWAYTIYGDFTYNGTTARASNPSDDYDIYSSDWSCSSHSVRASGASIIGSASFTSTNGVRKSVSPKLTCSPSGNLS